MVAAVKTTLLTLGKYIGLYLPNVNCCPFYPSRAVPTSTIYARIKIVIIRKTGFK